MNNAKLKIMDFLRESDALDTVIPGVTEAYKRLRSTNGQGIYTSLGRYYNHTIFGRDAGMAAKFVSDFDHEMAWHTILTLASYQGRTINTKTQEQPGRIHHELRDYATWQGRWYDRVGLWWAGHAWGMKNKQLLTYFAADTTATYIRLVHKYAMNIDRSILERNVPQRNGSVIPLTDSLEHAANWIAAQVNQDGCFMVQRTNRWSLPYQTFADSVTAYAWSDGTASDTSKPHSFVEVQAYAIDALTDAIRLLPDSSKANRWRTCIDAMQAALFRVFWHEENGTFSPGLFYRNSNLQPLDADMVTAGWTLNASFWHDMPDDTAEAIVSKLVKRLFREDFLTNVGLRTKSSATHEPLGSTIDYHGSHTVWPMFTFMVIEGLRRHGLYRLARQLEYRLINGINAVGGFPEFMIVDHKGTLYTPDKTAAKSLRGQMIPEQMIGFTVVPSLTLAYRHSYKRHDVAKDGWRYELEEAVLATISAVELISPDESKQRLSPTPLKIKRTAAGLQSAWHILPVILKKP